MFSGSFRIHPHVFVTFGAAQKHGICFLLRHFPLGLGLKGNQETVQFGGVPSEKTTMSFSPTAELRPTLFLTKLTQEGHVRSQKA